MSHCTTPLNFEMAALTLTAPALTSTALALTMTLEAAFTVIPFVLSSTELPLLSVSTTAPGPSSSVSFWPPGVSMMMLLAVVLIVGG